MIFKKKVIAASSDDGYMTDSHESLYKSTPIPIPTRGAGGVFDRPDGPSSFPGARDAARFGSDQVRRLLDTRRPGSGHNGNGLTREEMLKRLRQNETDNTQLLLELMQRDPRPRVYSAPASMTLSTDSAT